MYTEARRDLSQQEMNPTRWIQDHLQELGQYEEQDDARGMVQFVLDGVKPLIGKGFSAQNFKKMQMTLQRELHNGRSARDILVGYLNNYFLKGSGLGMESNAQDAIATMISEDNEPIKLTQRQMQLKRLIESATRLSVALLG